MAGEGYNALIVPLHLARGPRRSGEFPAGGRVKRAGFYLMGGELTRMEEKSALNLYVSAVVFSTFSMTTPASPPE